MIETVIVLSADGFQTLSGWIVSRTREHLVLAAIDDPYREPRVVAVPLDRIVTMHEPAA